MRIEFEIDAPVLLHRHRDRHGRPQLAADIDHFQQA